MRIFSNLNQDQEFSYLGSRGYYGTLNDRQYSYLADRGFKGTLDDMLFSLREFDPVEELSANSAQLLHYVVDSRYLFQDRAGTTPVTASGQPVGLWLSAADDYPLTAVSDAARGTYYESGGLRWVSFNGVNTAYQTPVLPAPGVDKVQLFTGVRKLSDAARGMVLELSATGASNNGIFNIEAPDFTAPSATMSVTSKGTVGAVATGSGITSPATRVLTGIGDISGDRVTLRINGAQVAQSTADQGTGNFNPSGTYPFYLGARAGTSLFFNGLNYGITVRFSAANLDTETITKYETWLETKVVTTL